MKTVNPSIGVFSFGRRESARCHDKMLRPFGKTTLTDILLNKLKHFGDSAFFAGRDEDFRKRCANHGVRFVERNEHSVSIDEPITDILSFLEAENFSHFLIVNGCLPFLSLKTIQDFHTTCLEDASRPAFGVVARQNFFLDSSLDPINFSEEVTTINTKRAEPVYEFAHALYFFEKTFFFKNRRYWNWSEVRYLQMGSRYELVDIDDEADFAFAETLWKAKMSEA